MEDEIIQKINKAATELNSLQQNNQELATLVTQQLNDLKARKPQNSAYYTIDSNLTSNIEDIFIPNPLIPEQRDELIDSLKVRLETALSERQEAIQNKQNLERECNDLQSLIQEYESGFEAVTTKLRHHASATEQGQIQLRREYEALLDAEKGITAALFVENTMLQTQLRNLSNAVRHVFDNETTDSKDQLILQLKKENEGLMDLLNLSTTSNESQIDNRPTVVKMVRRGVVEEFFETE
ncbi:hypothetical protein BDB01DRAFT_721061 [Pilobolus umbonatus]|nr:hypothetical protein BDB01DRAFT_721061 [Pilobolus umbonatus]